MKPAVLLLLAGLFSAFAYAQTVYESKDKQGPVFSETPSPGAQPIDLPPVNVIDIGNPNVGQKQQQAAPDYTTFTILSPQNQGTVHTNTGAFPVKLALAPALQSGNAIQVSLDGTTLPKLRKSLRFKINSSEWQSAAQNNPLHEIQVAVIDGAGNTLIISGPVKFYVDRAHRESGDAGGSRR